LGLRITAEFLCALLCELKNTREVSLLENILINGWILKPNHVGMEILIVELFHILKRRLWFIVMPLQDMSDRALNHTKCGEPQQIKLNKPKRLQVTQVLSFCPRCLSHPARTNDRHMLVQVIGNQDTARVTGARTNLSNQRLNVCLNMWVLY
jgi:hypothetical protein